MLDEGVVDVDCDLVRGWKLSQFGLGTQRNGDVVEVEIVGSCKGLGKTVSLNLVLLQKLTWSVQQINFATLSNTPSTVKAVGPSLFAKPIDVKDPCVAFPSFFSAAAFNFSCNFRNACRGIARSTGSRSCCAHASR